MLNQWSVFVQWHANSSTSITPDQVLIRCDYQLIRVHTTIQSLIIANTTVLHYFHIREQSSQAHSVLIKVLMTLPISCSYRSHFSFRATTPPPPWNMFFTGGPPMELDFYPPEWDFCQGTPLPPGLWLGWVERERERGRELLHDSTFSVQCKNIPRVKTEPIAEHWSWAPGTWVMN